MLVAGYSALDTQGATRVVSQYDKYGMSGSEASVTVTSLNSSRIFNKNPEHKTRFCRISVYLNKESTFHA